MASRGGEAGCTNFVWAPASPAPKQNCHPDRSVAQWRDLRFPATHHQTTFRNFSHNGRTHVTSRTNFLVLSLLGHIGLARVRSTLSPWFPQNSPHPPPPVSLLARMVLSWRPSFSIHSHRFTDRCAGRRAAVRPYDTAPDLYVGGAPAALVGRSGSSILAFAAALAAPRRPWPPFSHGVVAPAIPPSSPIPSSPGWQ